MQRQTRGGDADATSATLSEAGRALSPEAKLDAALEMTFPASDPVCVGDDGPAWRQAGPSRVAREKSGNA